MNKSLYNQENIDAYLSNRLSGEEKKLFESGLEKDPLIQNEINLQKDIIESLKNSRRLELKSRLNKIEVGGAANTFRFKIAASVLIIMSLLSGTYFFMNKTEQTSTAILPAVRSTPKPSIMRPTPLAFQKSASPVSKNVVPEKDISALPQLKEVHTGKSDEVIHALQEVKSPDLKTGFEDDEIKAEANVVVPEGNVISNDENYKSDIELSIQPSGENDFHYQYYSNKLYLYCDFQSKPYELLEWNTKKTKQLYLYFNNTFYELKNNQTEVTPLKAIHDKQLIKQLSNIKDK